MRGGQIAGCRLQNLAIGVAFRRQCRQPLLGLRQFGLGCRRARHQFRAALFVVTPLRQSAVRLQLELAQPLAILPHFGLDGVAALGALRVLGLDLLNGFGLLAHFFRDAH